MNRVDTTIKAGRIRSTIQRKYFDITITKGSAIYEPEYVAWLSAAQALGYTLPTNAQQQIQSNFIRDLRANGLLPRMKFGNLYGFGSVGFGNIDIPFPAKVNTITGSIVYTTGQGIKSDGASFLTAPFTAKEYVGIENNSAFITYISESSVVGANISAFLISDPAKLVLLAPLANGSTTSLYEAYTGNFDSTLPNSDHKGLYTLVPGTGPNGRVYKDGVKRNLVFTSGAPSNNASMLILRDTVFGAFYQKYMGAMFVFDSFNDADELAFRTAFNTYKTAIGLP
jgi:hypothetical protein